MRAVGTDLETGATADAPLGMDHDLRLGVNGLGIMAPRTMQTATFKENRCADAGAIVYGKALYVEDPTLGVGGDFRGQRFGRCSRPCVIRHGHFVL